MTNLQDYLRKTLGEFIWAELTRKTNAEKGGKCVLYSFKEGVNVQIPEPSYVSDEDIRNYIFGIIYKTNKKRPNGTLLNPFDHAIYVHQLIQKYDINNYIFESGITPETPNSQAKRMALEFVKSTPIAYYAGQYYAYNYGVCLENGIPMYGKYELVSDTDLRILVNKRYFKTIMTKPLCCSLNQIISEVKNLVFRPIEDRYFNCRYCIFNDGLKLDITKWECSPVTGYDFCTNTIALSYKDVFSNVSTANAFEQICQLEMPNDRRWRQLLLEMIGAAICGNAGKKVFVWQGKPGSFKSPLINVMKRFWGYDQYAHVSLRPNQMSGRFEFNNFQYSRFMTVDDAPNDKLPTKLISFAKQVSGGDDISAEKKRGRKYQIHVTAPLFIVTNHPLTYDPDQAFEERLVTLPFPETIPVNIGAPLREQLVKEVPVIFRMALEAHLSRIQEGREITSIWPINYTYDSTRQRDPPKIYLTKIIRDCCYYQYGGTMLVSNIYNFCNQIFEQYNLPKSWNDLDHFAPILRQIMEEVYQIKYDEFHRRMTVNGHRESCYISFIWNSQNFTGFQLDNFKEVF